MLANMNINRLIHLVLALGATSALAAPPELRDGDIVFQMSQSAQSVAVQKATGSPYSHMGVVILRQGKPFVFEAEGKVQYTPLSRWVARGVDGHFVAKRLQDASEVLKPAGVARLHKAAKQYEGRPYDPTFTWSDDRLYCSELVWKIYQRGLGVRIGDLQQVRAFKLSDPEVQRRLKERYGDKVPLDEPAISPGVMFASPRLVTVLER